RGAMSITKYLRQTGFLGMMACLIAACSQSATPLPNVVATSTLAAVDTPVPITELFSMTEIAIVRTQPAYASNTPVNSVENADFGNQSSARAATWTPVSPAATATTLSSTPATATATDTPVSVAAAAPFITVTNTATVTNITDETATHTATVTATNAPVETA